LPYGYKTRTIAKEEKKRIETFKMRCHRRIHKISWTDRITDKEVLYRVLESGDHSKKI